MSLRRWRIDGAGGERALALVAAELPALRPGLVHVRVTRAGVAFGDVMRQRGLLAPRRAFTPGYDVVGRVEAVGAGVGLAIGDRVAVFMPSTGFGGYAEQVVVPAKLAVEVPDAVSDDDAIALGLNYITAHQILHRVLRVTPGQTLLVHGAAGGVGTALLDLGSRAGLRLFGTASAGKHEVVRAYGATPIDYRAEDFVERLRGEVPEGLDAVTDPIGGRHLLRSRQVLRRGGTLVGFGLTDDVDNGWRGLLANLALWARLAISPGARFRPYGITMPLWSSRATCREDWGALLAQHAAEGLRPVIGATVPFTDAPEALALVAGAKVRGKVLLTLDG